MHNDSYSTILIPMGLSIDAKPSLRQLTARAEARAKLVVSGQEQIQYILNELLLGNIRVLVSDREFVLEVDIPRLEQSTLYASDPRRPRLLSLQDDSADESAQIAVASIERSADVVNKVGTILMHSNNCTNEIRHLENRVGVDTSAARKFHFGKQTSFLVTVADQTVSFKSQLTPKHKISVDALRFKAQFASFVQDPYLVKLEVLACEAPPEAVVPGATYRVCFHDLSPVERALAHVACELGLPLELEVKRLESTSTLKTKRLEVTQLLNVETLVQEFQECFALKRFASSDLIE